MNISKFAVLGLIICAITACGDDSESIAQQKRKFEEQQQILDAQHKREIECIQVSGNKDCDTSQNNQQQIAQSDLTQTATQVPASYTNQNEIPPGTYHNYYGNPQYGSWGADGVYHFNNPNSSQASQTAAFLAGAAVGGIAGHLLTKSEFDKQNPQGWQDRTNVVNNYIDRNGKSISSDEYYKRRAQSYKNKVENERRKNPSFTRQFEQPRTLTSSPAKPFTAVNTQPKMSLADKIKARNDFLQKQQVPAVPKSSLADKIKARNDFISKPSFSTRSSLSQKIRTRNTSLSTRRK